MFKFSPSEKICSLTFDFFEEKSNISLVRSTNITAEGNITAGGNITAEGNITPAKREYHCEAHLHCTSILNIFAPVLSWQVT